MDDIAHERWKQHLEEELEAAFDLVRPLALRGRAPAVPGWGRWRRRRAVPLSTRPPRRSEGALRQSRRGSRRIRRPVAAKTAPVSAAARGGTAGSPTPEGGSRLAIKWISTLGIPSIRSTG
jgi:hypothetical protein